MKKVLGFFLSFGYVETGRVAAIHMRHLDGYFVSIREAAQDLAHYFLDDYLELVKGEAGATLDGFKAYLYGLPDCNASAGIPFAWSHVNGEEWWPWDSMSELYPLLAMFYEVQQADDVLVRFLDPTCIDNQELAQEVREAQTWTDGNPPDYWLELGEESIFKPVVDLENSDDS